MSKSIVRYFTALQWSSTNIEQFLLHFSKRDPCTFITIKCAVIVHKDREKDMTKKWQNKNAYQYCVAAYVIPWFITVTVGRWKVK